MFAQRIEHRHKHHAAAGARCIGNHRRQHADTRQKPQLPDQRRIIVRKQQDRGIKQQQNRAARHNQAPRRWSCQSVAGTGHN